MILALEWLDTSMLGYEEAEQTARKTGHSHSHAQ
jgi:hypothetical protein